MGVKLKGISDVDGRTVEVDLNDLKGGGNSQILLQLVRYNYNSNGNPPPSPAQVRTNAEDVANTTVIWLNRSDFDNRDIKFLLMYQAIAGSKLYVQDINNSDSRAIFTLIEDPIDEGDYITLTVECEETNGTPLEGSGILLGILI